ncbi:MAG: YraN family protein [Planctomycetota bacterium]
MTASPPQVLGARGENAAVSFLRQLGYRILDTQFRNHFGEIDIIALDGDVNVFTEVKTRASTSDGQPFEAVNRRRQQRLTRAALAWLKFHNKLNQPARFDIISIVWPQDSKIPQITHYRNAFQASAAGQMF